MELKELNTKEKVMKEITNLIEDIFKIMDLYEISRPGSIAYQKLEEGLLWLQVMTQHIPFRSNQQIEDLGEPANLTTEEVKEVAA